MTRTRHPAAAEREALLLFERLADLEPGSGARAQLLAATTSDVRTIVAELEDAESRGISRLGTRFPVEAYEAPPPPARIGPFRLIEVLGTGGMGEVWRGERDDGLFEQSVAIKLIRRGIVGMLAADRFAEERRLLARMEHPHIARLIDGGVTPDGQHWLATEFVAGEPIDQALRTRPLSETVRLFLQAAQAVQYAHGRLVAHGDVKPANILVDAEGQAKLLDFGIAQLIDSDTAHVAGAFTAAFASPERLAGGAPTVADDVFALGRTLAVLTDRAADRELRAIVARATAPEGARYPNTQALIDDLDRWLRGRAVRAMNGGALYHLRKFVRRHVPGVAAAAAAIVLLAGTALVAERNAIRAQQARTIEALRFVDAHRAAHYLMFDLLDRLERRPGTLRLRAQIGSVAQRYLDRLAATPNPPVEVRLDVARGYLREAQTNGMGNAPNLADVDRAHRDLEAAKRMLETLRREQPHLPVLWAPFARAAALDCQSQLYGNRHDAAAALRAAGAGLDALSTMIPDATARAEAGWPVRICAGDALVWLDRTGDAIPLLERELASARTRPSTDPAMEERNLRILGEAYFYAHRYPDAERALRRAAVLENAAHRRDPFYSPTAIEAANIADDLASTYSEEHRFADELAVTQGALDLVNRQAALDPDDQQSARRALSLTRLVASALANLGRLPEAITLMMRADERWAALRTSDPSDATTARLSLLALQVTGDLQRKAGDARGCATYGRTAAGWDAFGRQWHLSPSDEGEAVAEVRGDVAACAGHGRFRDG